MNNAIAKMERKSTEVAAWMQVNIAGLRKGRSVGGIGSAAGVSGRKHGRKEGANIRISSAAGSLGSGRKAIQ